MPRITVDVTEEMQKYLSDQRDLKGISISFGANQLMEIGLKERNRSSRKKKKDVPSDNGEDIQVPADPAVGDKG